MCTSGCTTVGMPPYVCLPVCVQRWVCLPVYAFLCAQRWYASLCTLGEVCTTRRVLPGYLRRDVHNEARHTRVTEGSTQRGAYYPGICGRYTTRRVLPVLISEVYTTRRVLPVLISNVHNELVLWAIPHGYSRFTVGQSCSPFPVSLLGSSSFLLFPFHCWPYAHAMAA